MRLTIEWDGDPSCGVDDPALWAAIGELTGSLASTWTTLGSVREVRVTLTAEERARAAVRARS